MLIVKGIYFKNMDCLTVLTNLMPLILIAVFALYIARMSFKKSIKN